MSKGFRRAFHTYAIDLGGCFDPALSTPPPVAADDGRGRLADEAARDVLARVWPPFRRCSAAGDAPHLSAGLLDATIPMMATDLGVS